MAAHISTKQVLDYIKSVPKKISVDGVIHDDFHIDDESIIVDEYIFPVAYFDIAGMDQTSLTLVDAGHSYHIVQFHGASGEILYHPSWDVEEYDVSRLQHRDIQIIANGGRAVKQ